MTQTNIPVTHCHGIAGPAQPALGVAEAEPEGQGQPDPVGVDLEEPDVERDGDRSHGAGRSHGRGVPDPRRNRHPSSMPQAPGRVAPGRRAGARSPGPRQAHDGPHQVAPARQHGRQHGRGRAPRRGRSCENWPARWPSSPGADRGSVWPRPTRLAAAGCLGGRRRPRRGRRRSGPPAAIGGIGLQADVGRSDEWPGIVDAVTARFGGIDLAHLNAGVMTGEADITALTDETYRRIMSVNVDGVVFGVRALVPALAARGGGAIVATASLAGLIGFSPDPIYCLTKHAVVGLVRSVGPPAGRAAHHHQRRLPEHRGHPADRGQSRDCSRPAGSRSSIPARCRRRWSTDWPGRSPAQAMVIQAGREALAVPVRPTARSSGRRDGGTAAADGVRRPRSRAATQAATTGSRRAPRPVERRGPGAAAVSPGGEAGERGQPTRPTPAKPPPVRTPVIQTDGTGVRRFDHRAAPDVHGHVLRSPGTVEEQVTGLRCRPAGCGWWRRYWAPEVRGRLMPACAKDHWTRPGAVEADPGGLATPDVGDAELALGGLDGPAAPPAGTGGGGAVAPRRPRAGPPEPPRRGWSSGPRSGPVVWAFWAAANLALKAAWRRRPRPRRRRPAAAARSVWIWRSRCSACSGTGRPAAAAWASRLLQVVAGGVASVDCCCWRAPWVACSWAWAVCRLSMVVVTLPVAMDEYSDRMPVVLGSDENIWVTWLLVPLLV